MNKNDLADLWTQLWEMLSIWDNDDFYMNKVKKLFQKLQIECLNQHINDVEKIIKDFQEIHKYCDKWDYNIPTISWDKLKKWEAELVVSTPKQRRESDRTKSLIDNMKRMEAKK